MDEDEQEIELADLADLAEVADAGETVIAFADEGDEAEDEEPLVKKLRDEIRSRDRTISQMRRTPPSPANDADPEPAVPAVPDLEALDWDKDKFDTLVKARDDAVSAHAEWKTRQSARQAERTRASDEQARQIEQQRSALGVSDYEERSTEVKDALSEAQLAVLVNGAHNPARLIYALGRSPARLAQLAAEENLARFAVTLGALEKEIKVTKRTAPAADTPVRGATGSTTLPRADKELERLEKEAERTGDRSKIAAYRRKQREEQRAA